MFHKPSNMNSLILGMLLVARKLTRIVRTHNIVSSVVSSFRCYSHWILTDHTVTERHDRTIPILEVLNSSIGSRHKVASLGTRHCRWTSGRRPFEGTWRLHREGSGSLRQNSHHSPSDTHSYPGWMNRLTRSWENLKMSEYPAQYRTSGRDGFLLYHCKSVVEFYMWRYIIRFSIFNTLLS
jgi:hypothetical protein